MRHLTFDGYLSTYVRHLSGADTLSLARLAELARREPRLVEPLGLWAVESGRSDRLAALWADWADRASELETLESLRSCGELERALASGDTRLRPEYAKVWRSYQARANAPQRDAGLKMKARQRALELEAVRHVTRYRMAKDLGLNAGNLHAFLAQGNVSKVSLERARALVDYLEAAA